jgi:hypothetical protein
MPDDTPQPAPQPIAISRIVGAAFTLLASGFAIYMAITSYHSYQEFHALQVAEPVHFAADLSKVGMYEGPFNQTSRLAHGESIMLKLPAEPRGELPDYSVLEGLQIKGIIVTADGEEMTAFESVPDPTESWSLPGEDIRLAMIPTIPVGQYTLRLHVIDPAPALADKQQIVSAKYDICGMEELPALLAKVLAIAASIPALIVGLVTFIGWKHHGWRKQPATQIA